MAEDKNKQEKSDKQLNDDELDNVYGGIHLGEPVETNNPDGTINDGTSNL